MTKEQIIEIMVKWQPEIIFRDEYNTVASELQQLHEEEMKKAVELLKRVQCVIPSWTTLECDIDKFLKEQEEKK